MRGAQSVRLPTWRHAVGTTSHVQQRGHLGEDGRILNDRRQTLARSCAIREALRRLGIEVRAGLHTGEIELVADGVRGMAVHIGARVKAHAGAGEVVVSSTVKDLVAGSGITFADRGMHTLKGVPEEWRLFAVES